MSMFSFDLNQLPHCCGAYEAGNLTCGRAHKTYRDYEVDTKDDVVASLQRRSAGRPVFINFVQYYNEANHAFSKSYENQELMEAIQGKPAVIDLGTWINPGSSNRIHGFMIKGSNHEA